MAKIILNDSGVIFKEDTHQYFLGDKELFGVTSTLIRRAFPTTYENVPEEVLRKAAERGTSIHETIQFCEEQGLESAMPEYLSYERIKSEHKLTYITHEYIVTDEERYASAIDLVLMDEDGKIVIADIKTTYKPHYDNVALQLSIYKRFFEKQNPGLKVDRCVLLWLRDSNSEYKEMPTWADEALDMLIEADKKNEDFDVMSLYGDLPAKFAEVETEVANIEAQVKYMQDRQKTLREGLYSLMEEYNLKSWTGSKVKLTRVLPTESETFDSKAFKEAYPDTYKEFLKKTKRAGNLKVTLVKDS